MSTDEDLDVVSVKAEDVRFPTSLDLHGSDAMHTDPDYSCAYVTIETRGGSRGYGLSFTLGRGTELVVQAIQTLSHLVVGQNAAYIFSNFAKFWRTLTSDSQIRWVGPEKGVVHLAAGAITNGLWDLWARLKSKPLWKLLCDLEPEVLVSVIDFRYITDLITPEECTEILKRNRKQKEVREQEMVAKGYPAYTTQAGWLGYSQDKVETLCRDFLQKGFTAFKIKVGLKLEDDLKRCELVRRLIGSENLLMLDANQKWDVGEAVGWVKALCSFRPYWIEEPTSPDDVLGHLAISQELNPVGVKVAGGEMCANRVMFKQFLQAGALQVCQVDAARLGGINEILSVYFMAKKLNVPVCPHAGGVGLCEMVRHLQIFDYICLSGTTKNRMIEFVDQQHDHFEDPAIVVGARYVTPQMPGFSTRLKEETLERYSYPRGREWSQFAPSTADPDAQDADQK